VTEQGVLASQGADSTMAPATASAASQSDCAEMPTSRGCMHRQQIVSMCGDCLLNSADTPTPAQCRCGSALCTYAPGQLKTGQTAR
jgi:hypothetical protein